MATYRDTVIADAPRAYWRLDELTAFLGGRNVRDASGNGWTGLINGAPIQGFGGGTSDGDKAMYFNATTDFVSVPSAVWDPSGVNSWSMEFMAFIPEWASTTRRVLGVEGTQSHGVVIFYASDNTVRVFRGDSGATIDQPVLTPALIPIMIWHHFVVTYDGVNIRGYWNGALFVTSPSSRAVDTSTATLFEIGRTQSNATVHTGGLDEVSLYNYAMTDAQAAAHYAAATGPNGLPQFTSQLGQGNSFPSLLGSVQLGGAPGNVVVPLPLPALPKRQTLAFIGHLYTNTLIFKKSLGPLLNRPKLTWTLNSGHHPVQLDVPIDDTSSIGPAQGDVVRLTEQGGDGKIVYSGYVNDIVLHRNAVPPYVSLMIEPFITELGEAYFDNNYSTVTDIGQMARDVISATTHCTFTPQSIPLTGIGAIYNFRLTTVLEAMNTLKHIGGPNFWFYIDEYGIAWFQPVNLKGTPYYTLRGGSEFTVRKKSTPLTDLKNYVVVAGGVPDQAADGNALTAIYRDPASIKKYGLRFFYPILYYPAAVDQQTLNRIALTVGTVMNQLRPKITVTLPNYGNRFVLGRHGGPSIRYWEPATEPMAETLTGSDISQAAGAYSPNYVVLEVEMDGPQQILTLGPLPVTSDDFKYAIDGTIARMTHTLLLYPPLSSVHYDLITSGTIGNV